MKSLEQFQINLRHAMESTGVTQREIAKRAGLSYAYVNRILTGIVTPSINICESLALAIGLQLPELLTPPNEFRKKFKKFSVSA